MTGKTFVFDIHNGGERSAGIMPYSDTVTVVVESGETGGDHGEFEEHMKNALAEWYDGAHVRLRKEGECHEAG